jgi:hypothetical protein
MVPQNILAPQIYSVSYFGVRGPSFIPGAEANHAEAEGAERMLPPLQSRNGKNEDDAQPLRKVYQS